MEWLTVYLEQFTYVGVAVSLLLAGLGIPLPEDIPLIFGGVMAGAGKINVWWHFAISMTFIIIGDTSLYLIGRKLGKATDASQASKGRLAKLLTPERRVKVAGYFERWGNWTIFFGRFIAGFRGAIYLTAGVVGFPLRTFIFLDFIAALISVPVWIWLGWYFGENWEVVIETAKSAQGWVLIVVGAGVVGVLFYFKVWRKRKKAE